jgi:hypothetical protein
MLELTFKSLFILMENCMLSRNSNNIKLLTKQQAKGKF